MWFLTRPVSEICAGTQTCIILDICVDFWQLPSHMEQTWLIETNRTPEKIEEKVYSK